MSPTPQNRIDQELHLTFRYTVHFTEGVFSASNIILRDAIAERADHKPARTIFVVDSAVAVCHPGLSAEIEASV